MSTLPISNTPMFLVSRDGTILETNMSVSNCFGYSSNVLTGKDVTTVIDRLDLDATCSEVRLVSSLGTPMTLLAVNSLIVDDSLRPYRHIISLVEIDKLPTVETRLADGRAQVEAMKGELQQFISCVSHDLRSPLVNIEGFVVELEELVDDLRERREKTCNMALQCNETFDEIFSDMQGAISYVDTSIKRLKRLVNSVVDIHKNRTRKLEDEPTDIGRQLKLVVSSMQHQIQRSHCSIRINTRMPTINIDPYVVERIFANVIDNSIKYLEPTRNGQIDIDVTTNNKQVVFSVRDNGIGINEGNKKYVFQIFRRATDRDIPGDGVGMPMVRSLVDLYNGEIWFNSKEGTGTTFYIAFPKSMLV